MKTCRVIGDEEGKYGSHGDGGSIASSISLV